MKAPLQVLLISDADDDRQQIDHYLQPLFLPTVACCEHADEVQAALVTKTWDVVVANYATLPLKRLSALEFWGGTKPVPPLIYISDTPDELIASAVIRAGAEDFLTTDNLTRLGAVIERALRQVQIQRELQPRQAGLGDGGHPVELASNPLLAQEHEQRLRAETLAEVTLALASQTSPEDVLNEILRQMRRLIPYRAAHIMLIDGNELRIGAWHGYQQFKSEEAIANLVQSLSDFPIDREVVATCRPIVVPDTRHEARWVSNEETNWIRSSIIAPIGSCGRIRGLLRLDAHSPNTFSEEDSVRLLPLINAAAIALENARLFEQAQQQLVERAKAQEALRQRNEQLAFINQATQTFISTLKLDDVLNTVLESIRNLLDVTALSIWLVDPEAQELVCQQATDPQMETARGWRLALGEGIAGWVAKHGQPQIVTDARQDPRHHKKLDQHIGLETRSILSMPLQVKDKTIGALQVVDSNPNRFSASDQQLIEPIAAIAAIAIENARLYQAVQQDLDKRRRTEEKVRRGNRELKLLNRIIAASVKNIDSTKILTVACRELSIAFNAPGTIALLFTEDSTAAKVVAEYQTNQMLTLQQDTVAIEDDAILQYLLKNKEPYVFQNSDSAVNSASPSALLAWPNIKSLLSCPLMINQEIVGSLTLIDTKPRAFPYRDINLAWRVAEQVSGALSHAQLIQTHQRLTTVVEQSPEGIFITDTGDQILYVNPAFERITGYSQVEAIGHRPNLLKSGEHDPSFYQQLWETITHGQVWHGRFTNRRKDETLYIADTIISPIRTENGDIVNYVSIQRDVTRELQLEKKYLQAQKMEAIGMLVAGIAHDFNNILTVINGFAEILQADLPPDQARLYDLVSKILVAGEQASTLIRHLLIFSRTQVVDAVALDLNAIIANTGQMLERLIEENIVLELELDSDLWPVKADPTQIEQVIINLVVNARDAMPNGGQITLQTSNVLIGSNQAESISQLEAGDYVLLSVHDTGHGMTETVKSRIFDPFFTTKADGKGTGLGLATVLSVVHQSFGHIEVISAPGQGATFRVYLPRTMEVSQTFRGRDQNKKAPQGSETILVVEDDPAVQELSAQLLRRRGYTVLTAANGVAALEVCQTYHDPIHLLLTDTVMPEMGGPALAEKIRELRPEVKILLTSGYSDKPRALHAHDSAAIDFIPKPFTAVELAQKVRALLDRPN